MLRLGALLLRRSSGGLFGPALLQLARPSSFRPFSQKDEDDLVKVLKTRPHHVLKHVRQVVWRSHKRELHFRNTVTHLMIVLQEFLRKQLIDPAAASRIMEGTLEECVVYSQHDMAHLLFRAFLRFRKYGCVITVDSIRYLFESYKVSDSTDLMLQLANEMKADAELRPLCIAAYLFAGAETEAEELLNGVALNGLSKDDYLALIAGYEKLNKADKLFELLDAVKQRNLTEAADVAAIYEALLRVFWKKDMNDAFGRVLEAAVEAKVQFDSQMYATILRQKVRCVTSVEEVARVEAEMTALGYVPDVTGNSIIITVYARLLHYRDRGSEELMLSKVDTLLSSIESRLKQGDPDMDISAAHVRAVIRGYGAAGRPEALQEAWTRMQYPGLTDDVRVYNEVLKWLSLMGNVKGVLAIKAEMDAAKLYPDSLSYTWIFRALGKYYPRHVEELYSELQSRNVRPEIQLYTTLIGVFGDLRQYDTVQALLTEIRKREDAGTLQFTPLTFAVLIRVYSKDIEMTTHLYAEAKRRNLHEHPHVQTSMLHALGTQHRPEAMDDVTKFLATIPTRGTDIYNVLLSMYSKKGDKATFEKTLETMRHDNVPMNDVTFGTLITAFARWGESEKVSEATHLMKENGGEVTAAFYSVLASSLNRMGNTEGVTDAWDDLVASKLFPGTEVYNQFLTLYSAQNDISKMHGVLDAMLQQIPPNPVTATTVLDVLGKSGKVNEMEALFDDMKSSPDTHPTSVTYHQMMNAYAKSGDVAKMEKLHEEFLSNGHADNAVTYNILIDGYGRAKNFEQLEDVVKVRVQNNIPLDDLTYCIMTSAYGKAKMEAEVQRLYTDIQKPENKSLLTKRSVWPFIDAFCRCGNKSAMNKCVDLLKETSDTQELQLSDCNGLIPYFCRVGEMERIEELEKMIADKGGDVSYVALNAIARGYTRVGRFDKAVETLHKLRDRNWVPDAATALHLSGAFLKAGLHEQATQIIQWRRQYTNMLAAKKGCTTQAQGSEIPNITSS